MTRIRSFALAALAAPLTLAIAACDSTDASGEEALSGEPVAAVEAPAGTTYKTDLQASDAFANASSNDFQTAAFALFEPYWAIEEPHADHPST